VISFSNADEAIDYCLQRDVGVAIFIIDVFLGGLSGFYFLDAIEKKFPTAHEDSIIISGNASDDVVNMCLASRVNYLLEKPIKPYALQLILLKSYYRTQPMPTALQNCNRRFAKPHGRI
jgi:CheY-like chemotaxis protein